MPASSGRRVPVHRQLDGQAGGADLLDQLARALQARHRLTCRIAGCRRRIQLARLAEHPEHPAHVGQASRPVRSIASSADRAPFGSSVERSQAGAGLDDDHADVVGDDVVEFARDAFAFVLDGPPRSIVALRLLEAGVLLDRCGVAASRS